MAARPRQGGRLSWILAAPLWAEGFPGGAIGKEPACQGRRHKRCRFDSWVGKIPWSKGMATHSSIPAWRTLPWTEEPGGLQSRGSHRVGHNWATNTNVDELNSEIQPAAKLRKQPSGIIHAKSMAQGPVPTMEISKADKRMEAHAQGPHEITYESTWASVGRTEGWYGAGSRQRLALVKPQEIPPALRGCPMGRREESGGSETCGQDQFQLRLLPLPPECHAWKWNLQSKKRTVLLQTWCLLPAPLSSPRHVCTHTHPHTHSFTICLSLRLLSLWLFYICTRT